ncbi:hypothetical protein TTY48_40740 [Tsukamurella sp. TY48]|uniref:hypothetical protein n=1 Tax=Tsukamurella TaxID=2060 RepID=UPI001C7D1A8A|nr:hypothetical protein [Tsukamurella sp. TY48]GIZ99462.1 hypothetical protein TTY48_40740 [Tsukamurella sp. TY48]
MSSDDKPQASPHEPTSGTEGTPQDGANAPTGQFPGAYPVPGYVAPGAPPAGYPPQQPVGPGCNAPPPGYSAPPPGYPAGYPQGNGYPAYPQQQYGWGAPSAPEPGSVPLRPLSLGDIYGGAITAIRTNPGVMIGFTAIIVVLSNLVAFIGQIPLTDVTVDPGSEDEPAILSTSIASGASALGGALISMIATTILTGMLTVVVARSVLGDKTGAGSAWRALVPRLWPLIGLVVLQALIYLVPTLIMIGLLTVALVGAGSWVAGVFVAILMFVIMVVIVVGLMPAFAMATASVVLEGRGSINALRRGFQLQRPGFWRLLGIMLLTYLIVMAINTVVGIPFNIGLVLAANDSTIGTVAGTSVLGLALSSIGTAIGGIITMPFMSSVQTLLYTDQRMRTERFDLVLQSAAAYQAQTGLPAGPGVWAPPRPV